LNFGSSSGGRVKWRYFPLGVSRFLVALGAVAPPFGVLGAPG
jgi:hypothetical protein